MTPDPSTREREQDEKTYGHLSRSMGSTNPHRLAGVIWAIALAGLPVFVIAGMVARYMGWAQ